MAANVMASKDSEVNLILILILINSVCVSITAVVTSMQAIIRGLANALIGTVIQE